MQHLRTIKLILMILSKCIAFHSYKGGTGKTTIAANLAATLAKKGNVVALIDLDIYAPSLSSYFSCYHPKNWVNDFLQEKVSIHDILIDYTSILGETNGKFYIGFSNYHKDEIYKLDININQIQNTQLSLFRNFILLKEEIMRKKEADYIIIDTSPGVRFWSINALAISDIILLMLKFGDLDFDGTKLMCEEIYSSFSKFGTKSYLLLNKVEGYCTPPLINIEESQKKQKVFNHNIHLLPKNKNLETLTEDIQIDVLSQIPCYCDIQFDQKEYLTVLNFPNHPFVKNIELIAKILSDTK